MNNVCPNIVEFHRYWKDAPMVRDLYSALEGTYLQQQDGTVCAAKAMVKCACKTIVQELDDPDNPVLLWKNGPLKAASPSLSNWMNAATQLLDLVNDKTDPLNGLIGQYNQLAIKLGTYRNNLGNIGHGKAGFDQKLTTHHRRAALLIADTIVGFLHDAYLLNQTDPEQTFEPYEKFNTHNNLIDQELSLIHI